MLISSFQRITPCHSSAFLLPYQLSVRLKYSGKIRTRKGRFGVASVFAASANFGQPSVQQQKMFNKMLKNKYGIDGYGKEPEDVHLRLDPLVQSKATLKPTQIKRLRKLLFEHIRQTVASRSIEKLNPIAEKLEISKIELSQDLCRLKISWLARGTAEDSQTQSVLNSAAADIKSELSNLKFVGRAPDVEFIMDYSQAQLTELTRRLDLADTGEPKRHRLTPVQEAFQNSKIVHFPEEIIQEHLGCSTQGSDGTKSD